MYSSLQSQRPVLLSRTTVGLFAIAFCIAARPVQGQVTMASPNPAIPEGTRLGES